MSRRAMKDKDTTVEDLKEALDKEQLCLFKAKGILQQQLKVLQVGLQTHMRRVVHKSYI